MLFQGPHPPSFWEDDLVFYFSKITTISKKSSLLHFTYLHSLTLLLSFYLTGSRLFFIKACISTFAFNLIPFCFPLTLAPSINSFTQQFQPLCSFHSSTGPLPLALKKKKKRKKGFPSMVV